MRPERPDPTVAEQANWAQYEPGQRKGHYESFYQRANDPVRPLAFWIRYTVFSPSRRPADAVGELWFVLFDGETGQHVVAKQVHPIAACDFDRRAFSVRISDATLGPGKLAGAAGDARWQLTYSGDHPPLYLLPPRLYRRRFPEAKSLVGTPLARYHGELVVGERNVAVDGWLGSQNHNWGSRHTERYAFGQVAGFDGVPSSFLEVVTASNRIGPVNTPPVTLMVLRHRGKVHSLVSPWQGIRASAHYQYFRWEFASQSATTRVRGHIEAPAEAFVGLAYANPPGGTKQCLNTKIARCELEVTDRVAGVRDRLRSEHCALFEILTDDRAHGIPIRA